MKALLGFLITGCFHKWETMGSSQLDYQFGTCERVKMRCEKCGNWKVKNLKGLFE